MKKVNISENSHQSMVNSYGNIDQELENLGFCYYFKLADRMRERNLTVRKLSALSGLRLATISDMMRGKKNSINMHHIVVLMAVLRLDSITELVDIRVPASIKDEMITESTHWKKTHEVPEETLRLSAIINANNEE
ncbi:MAG: helix-turn-helix transcriptional regulator [bacterium]|nr:helix-turn-helix transcriptional regulator [bacterium]